MQETYLRKAQTNSLDETVNRRKTVEEGDSSVNA